jgi:hypothetical protein
VSDQRRLVPASGHPGCTQEIPRELLPRRAKQAHSCAVPGCRCLRMAPYVTVTGPTDRAIAAGGRSCCLSSARRRRPGRRDRPARVYCAGVPRVPDLRGAGPRLCPGALRALCPGAAGAVLMQGPGVLSKLRGPPDDEPSGGVITSPSGASGLPHLRSTVRPPGHSAGRSPRAPMLHTHARTPACATTRGMSPPAPAHRRRHP